MATAREYRTFAEFEREVLSKTDRLLQSLEEFHQLQIDEEPEDLFDRPDGDAKGKGRGRPRRPRRA